MAESTDRCSRSAVSIPNSPCTVMESFQHLCGITLKPLSDLKDPVLLGIHGAEDLLCPSLLEEEQAAMNDVQIYPVFDMT